MTAITACVRLCASDGGERKRHLDLAEHCLRGLSYIYSWHRDSDRAAAMDDLLETVQSQRQRLDSQALPAEGLTALLPRRPWTQSEMTQRLTAALRELSTGAPPDGPTVAPPGGQMVAPPGQQNGTQENNSNGT